jgi:hypothetical protein
VPNRTLRVGTTAAKLKPVGALMAEPDAVTPGTVLSDGDEGPRKLQRRVLPKATVVLDWFHIATRFELALQTAIGLADGTVDVL